MTPRILVLLLSVLCLPTPAAVAQDDAERMVEVLCLDDPECLARAKYRLTADNLRRMFAVDRELFTLMKEAPELKGRMDELGTRLDPQRRLRDDALTAQVLEGIPEIAQILRTHRISGREFLMTYSVAMVTAMADDSFPDGALMTPALKFWRSMPPALKAEADAWKKMRGYDKGLNR